MSERAAITWTGSRCADSWQHPIAVPLRRCSQSALDQVTIGIADIRAGVDNRDVERDRDG